MTQISFDRPADKIRAKFNAERERILARNELTQTAKNARVALAMKTANAELAAAESASNEARRTARARNERTAFGLDDLASSPGDKATLAMAYRNAAERVTAIKTPSEASRLLGQAHDTGDETMARAIAKHANDMVVASDFLSPDWLDVLNDYASQRPAAFAAIEAIHAEQMHRAQGAEMFEFAIVTPSELGRATTDAELDRVIAQDPSSRV